MIDLAIARSMAIYYGRPIRLARLVAFYRSLLPRGGLYFAIGAHVGHRVWAARKAGAQAVAVEPQPSCLSTLHWLFDQDPFVSIVSKPVAECEKNVTLHISESNPTVTSTNQEWINQVGGTRAFRSVRWSRRISQTATTLDALIEAHGLPDFCKIDIEGSEAEALGGLSRSIGLISIERLPQAPDAFEKCLHALTNLDDYRFNWTVGERPAFASQKWLTKAALGESLRDHRRVCDVFAALPATIGGLNSPQLGPSQ